MRLWHKDLIEVLPRQQSPTMIPNVKINKLEDLLKEN